MPDLDDKLEGSMTFFAGEKSAPAQANGTWGEISPLIGSAPVDPSAPRRTGVNFALDAPRATASVVACQPRPNCDAMDKSSN